MSEQAATIIPTASAVARSRPVIHKSGCSVKYGNPWSTFEEPSVGKVISWKLFGEKRAAQFPTPEEAAILLPSVPIDKPLLERYVPSSSAKEGDADQQAKNCGSGGDPKVAAVHPVDRLAMTCTWCGHSAFVVQQGGVSILTDPVWADRCSPVSFIGPKRMVPLPILIPDLCPIDIVTISHNHYDHLDTAAVQQLIDCFDPLFLVPIGMKANSLKSLLRNETVDAGRFVELGWWDEVVLVREEPIEGVRKRGRFVVAESPYEVPDVTAETEAAAEVKLRAEMRKRDPRGELPVAVRVASVPVQHWSMRSGFDRHCEQWCGFVARISTCRPGAGDDVDGSTQQTNEMTTRSVFHCGDTGYCQSFQEIGGVFQGGIDLGLIPIGAYLPRNVMRPQHVDPAEAVLIHEEIHSRYSIGMHWGTFILTDEAIDEPPKKLAELMEQRRQRGTAAAAAEETKEGGEEVVVYPFVVQKHGESTVIPIVERQKK